MAKAQRGIDAGNGRNAGKRRRTGDPFGDLRERVKAFERGLDRDGVQLTSFILALSLEQRAAIVRGFCALPRGDQKRLHRQLMAASGGSVGPCGTFWGELIEGLKSQNDSLPDPESPPLPPKPQLPSVEEVT
jgi:hypothetical protein